jgi:hypothetical protein
VDLELRRRRNAGCSGRRALGGTAAPPPHPHEVECSGALGEGGPGGA